MKMLDLPRRRYSVPETIMRKYRLRQRGNCISSGETRRRRCADKSIQTSPRDSIGRTSSFPFLATPSPCVWSYATSDCQTVSERTTSTQDSTLSVPSTTPDRSDTPLRTEEVETQVSFPERADRTTSMTGLPFSGIEETLLDIAVSIETDMSGDTVVDNRKKGIKTNQNEEKVSIACQTGNRSLFKVPDINVFKDSSESQSDNRLLRTKEESSQVTVKDISKELDYTGYQIRNVKAEVACPGSNYDEFPLEKPVVPRYSAIPRTNSMLVNASSFEYSSDSDLSLTDSLEDPDEYRTTRSKKHSKHDERMVRGEVTVQQERRRLPKARDAYAYFLSLTGEEEIIREYSIPEWLRTRLRQREIETKKEYEDKLMRHQQCAYYRRRKKGVRRINRVHSYSSGDRIEKTTPQHKKNENKAGPFEECTNNNVNKNNFNPGPSTKNTSMRLINGNNIGLEPKIDNIHRNKHINNNNNDSVSNHNGNKNGETNQEFVQSGTINMNNSKPSCVEISEVIKIEMNDSTRTIITKEKQINLSSDINSKPSIGDSLKKELSHSMKSIITKNSDNSYTMELTGTNIHQPIDPVGTKKEDINKSLRSQEEKLPTINETSPEKKVNHLKVPDIKIEKYTPKDEATQDGLKAHHEKNIEIDRRIAGILITALEENTKARQKSMSTNVSAEITEEKTEHQTKSFVDQGSQKNEYENETESETIKTISIALQTDDNLSTKEENKENIKRCDKSCNTEPYLVSISLQTSDRESQDQESSESSDIDICEDKSDLSFEEVEDLGGEYVKDGNLKMVDKSCNTVESKSISTQTNESILQSDDIVNRVRKGKTEQKKDVQFPPQVIKQIITGTGEYMTVEVHSGDKSRTGNRGRTSGGKRGRVHRGTNTDETESGTENYKNIINNNTELMSNRTAPTPFCKNTFPSKGHQKKSQVLELNVPACSCHMCTLQKISPRGDNLRSKIPQSRKIVESKEERKQTQKTGFRRSNTKGSMFRMFEVIPEEKNSSTESIPEDGTKPDTSKKVQMEKQEKGVLTEPHLVDQIVQVGSNIVNAATNTEPHVAEATKTAEGTQTGEQSKKKSNLLIGRFRSENRESPLRVRQYKGRASLSTGHMEGQEELLTLSKGWINFYLLKDNLELSDTNGEEVPTNQTQITSRRRIQTIEKEEDKIEAYTLEIHATPEPEPRNNERQRIVLPEINTSSSSSTPEGDKKKPSKPAVEPLPGVRKSKRTRRSQINMTREDITEMGRAYRKGTQDQKSATRAVEVACSEQSISSITSSTVILSESPPPQQLKLPERRSYHRSRIHKNTSHRIDNGSNWTVTVAGSSGSGNDPPPDVEMKLTFGKQGRKQEEGIYQYQVARTKRQDQMIEEYAHVSKNEKHTQLHCDLQTSRHPKSSLERTRGGTARDIFNYEEDYINRLSSRRSKYSTEDGSETTGDLHVTGLAITPEKKPRVPTQSERDILRPQRYKFTR